MPKGIYGPLTDDAKQKIFNEYLEKPVKRLADELGISYGRIMNFLQKHALSIPREIIEQRKKDSYLKKGQIPPNKGRKQIEYMTIEAIERTAKTRFKKGNEPINTKHDGCISTRKEKNGKPYQYIRISKSKWELYHRHIWEQVNGKIPENHIIAFKDGNALNCELSNLELITKEENMMRNSIQNYPKEVIPSLKLISKINKKIKNHGKKQT